MPTSFDEAGWMRGQVERARILHKTLTNWLGFQTLNAELRARIAGRVLAGEGAGRTASPAILAGRMAESLGAPEDTVKRLGIAATLFWASADVADDVDDGDEKELPFANDACTLIFLAQRALVELSPLAVAEGIHYGLEMANGQTRDLVSTDRPQAPDVESIISGKAGAELELFLTLAGIAAGNVTPALRHLGRTLGAALQVFSDVADLYMKPVSADFLAGKWTLPLLLYRKGADTAALEALRRHRFDVQARMRFEAAGFALNALRAHWAPFEAAWANLAPDCPNPLPFAEVVAWLKATFEALDEALADLEEPPAPQIVTAQEAIDRGLRYLAETDGVEEHRWGFLGAPYVAGDLFPLIFKTATLRQCGMEWRKPFEKLLALRDEDGWRYYPARAAIPADADDTGLILGSFHDVLPEAVTRFSIGQLKSQFHDDAIHTWMGPMPDDIEWAGDDCLATLSNVTWGLVRAGHGSIVPPAVWQRLATAAAGEDFPSPFYPPVLTRFFVHRATATGVASAALTPEQGQRAREALGRQMQAEERLAGNYTDSVQHTTATLLAAAQWRGFPGLELRARALQIWLSERQESDGSWLGEPFFLTPGVGMRPQFWGHPVVTTAWVILALSELNSLH